MAEHADGRASSLQEQIEHAATRRVRERSETGADSSATLERRVRQALEQLMPINAALVRFPGCRPTGLVYKPAKPSWSA